MMLQKMVVNTDGEDRVAWVAGWQVKYGDYYPAREVLLYGHGRTKKEALKSLMTQMKKQKRRVTRAIQRVQKRINKL